MKITAITPLICHARMRNWIFVKVETDQPGLFGWGEATLEWHTRAVIEVNESAIAEHPFQQELPQRVFYKDGAVGDW